MNFKKLLDKTVIICSFFSNTIYANSDSSSMISDEQGGIIVIALAVIFILYKLLKFVYGFKNAGKEFYNDQNVDTIYNGPISPLEELDELFYFGSFHDHDK